MRTIRFYIFSALCIWAGLVAQIADAACEEKYAFDDIRVQTGDLFRNGIPLSQSQNDNLGRALDGLDLRRIYPKLTAHRQTIHAPFLNTLINDLNTLRQFGRRNLVTLSAANMDKAEQVFEELCDSVLAMEIETQEVSQRLVFELLDFSFTNPFRGGDATDIRSYFDLSLVFFFLLGLISLIVFCWKAYVLAFPLIRNRKSCKIPATLRVLDLDVVGHAVVLGREGLQFVPENEIDSTELFDLLRRQENLPLIEVVFGETVFVAELQVMAIEHYVGLFQQSLNRHTLNLLYNHSLVPPRFVSKRSFTPNMKSINPKFE